MMTGVVLMLEILNEMKYNNLPRVCHNNKSHHGSTVVPYEYDS